MIDEQSSSMRLCPSCTTQLGIDESFCGHCGHHLLAEEETYATEVATVHDLPKPMQASRRFTLFSAISVCVIVLLMVSLLLEVFGLLPHFRGSPGSIVSPTPGTRPQSSCGGAVSDGFYGQLNEKWQWVDPSSSADHHLDPQGPLSISASPNSDLYPPFHNVSAPRLLQPITGDFTLSTLVSLSLNKNYQSAGILIWQDKTTFLRFEIAFGLSKESGVTFQQDDHTAFSSISSIGQHPVAAGSIELRVQKQGDHFTAWYRVPGQSWQAAGETDLHFDTLQVGLDLIADYSAPRTTATYDYFTVSCP